MPALNADQKRFIVQGLACFKTPSEVAEAVKEEFGIEVPREQVRNYNPLQVEVAEKWRALFAETRERFLADVAEIGIAHQSFRLRELLDLYHNAKRSRNAMLAASLLEQAAKERGGMYTNRREVSGPGGGPIPLDRIEVAIVDPRGDAAD